MTNENEATTIEVNEVETTPELAPFEPTTSDYQMDDEERAFRMRHEPHRKLSRCYKPPITAERLNELETYGSDNLIVTSESAFFLRQAKKNGLLEEKDMVALRQADAKRAKRNAVRAARSGDVR